MWTHPTFYQRAIPSYFNARFKPELSTTAVSSSTPTAQQHQLLKFVPYLFLSYQSCAADAALDHRKPTSLIRGSNPTYSDEHHTASALTTEKVDVDDTSSRSHSEEEWSLSPSERRALRKQLIRKLSHKSERKRKREPADAVKNFALIEYADTGAKASKSTKSAKSAAPSTSSAPSVSSAPSLSSAPSGRPSTSSAPSLSSAPSTAPSESSAPSLSTQPSLSTAPSLTPSLEPSESSAPSESFQPSISTAPSQEPSSEPSLTPSLEPSESSAPSESSQPSISTAPSQEPSTSSAPSEQPSTSTAPSISSAPSKAGKSSKSAKARY